MAVTPVVVVDGRDGPTLWNGGVCRKPLDHTMHRQTEADSSLRLGATCVEMRHERIRFGVGVCASPKINKHGGAFRVT